MGFTLEGVGLGTAKLAGIWTLSPKPHRPENRTKETTKDQKNPNVAALLIGIRSVGVYGIVPPIFGNRGCPKIKHTR